MNPIAKAWLCFIAERGSIAGDELPDPVFRALGATVAVNAQGYATLSRHGAEVVVALRPSEGRLLADKGAWYSEHVRAGRMEVIAGRSALFVVVRDDAAPFDVRLRSNLSTKAFEQVQTAVYRRHLVAA